MKPRISLDHRTASLDHRTASELEIGYEDGWIGAFTRHQAAGAIPNGTPIVKLKTDPAEDNINPEGTRGVVLGSIDGSLVAPDLVREFNARFMY